MQLVQYSMVLTAIEQIWQQTTHDLQLVPYVLSANKPKLCIHHPFFSFPGKQVMLFVSGVLLEVTVALLSLSNTYNTLKLTLTDMLKDYSIFIRVYRGRYKPKQALNLEKQGNHQNQAQQSLLQSSSKYIHTIKYNK